MEKKEINEIPENVINVDFESFDSKEQLDLESDDSEIDILKKVVKRHNTVLKMLYGMIEDVVVEFEKRVCVLEKAMESDTKPELA